MRVSTAILALCMAGLMGATSQAAVQGPPPPPPPPAPTRIQGTPARDTRPQRIGTSQIKGRVLNAEGGAPVRRATVRLSSSELREGRATTTDIDGNYEFKDLPGGTYAISASKAGYLSLPAGAQQPGEMGSQVKIGDGQVVAAPVVLLPRGAAISGRVLDEFGEPTAGIFVQVMRRQSVNGVRRLVAAGSSGATNDLGQFRVYGLQPGTYYVTATSTMQMGMTDVDVPDRLGYAPTYYPGTPSVNDAQPIELGVGQDANGVDFMLSLARLSRVSGFCIDSQGRPIASGTVAATLIAASGPMGGSGAQIRPDGTFVLQNLAPGEYALVVRRATTVETRADQGRVASRSSQMEVGVVRLNVAGGDMAGVTIQTSPGSTLSGQVVWEGAVQRTQQRVTISTMPADPLGYNIGIGGGSAQSQSDNSFQLTQLFGDRVLRASAPQGWALKGIYLDGNDVADVPVSFDGRSQVTGVRVVMTDKVTHVTGTVSDERGQPADNAYVVIAADDPEKWMPGSRYNRTAAVREGSGLKVDGLPPGAYVALAVKSLQGIDVQDADFYERVRKIGVRFTLNEGETKDVPLKLSSPR